MKLDIELSLLEKDQIEGKDSLKVFDKIGTQARVTDYAIVCGANIIGWYWTKTCAKSTDAYAIYNNGLSRFFMVDYRSGGIRLAVPFSKIKDICSNEIIGKYGEIKYVCGELPQQVISQQLEIELKEKLNKGLLKKVDYIITDSVMVDEYEKGFVGIRQNVYENQGEKYALVKINSYEDKCTLSNKKTYKIGDNVFIKYQPLVWIKDKDSDIAFTEDLIASGVQFNNISNYKGDFEKTVLYQYINTYLVRTIFSSYMENSDLDKDISSKINYNNNEMLIKPIDDGGYQKVHKMNVK